MFEHEALVVYKMMDLCVDDSPAPPRMPSNFNFLILNKSDNSTLPVVQSQFDAPPVEVPFSASRLRSDTMVDKSLMPCRSS